MLRSHRPGDLATLIVATRWKRPFELPVQGVSDVDRFGDESAKRCVSDEVPESGRTAAISRDRLGRRARYPSARDVESGHARNSATEESRGD
jgi:hypothetical protein